MLEKTFKLLSTYVRGSHVSDPASLPYDEAELEQLGKTLSRLIYSPPPLRKFLQAKFGVTLTRADFYSEIPTIEDLQQAFAKPSLLALDKIFPPNEAMIDELMKLMPAAEEFAPPNETSSSLEYAWNGGPFSYSDAMAYYTMIRTRKPKVIVEIGSGWSTRIARQACKENGQGKIICIEPFPSDALKELPDVEIIQRRAQDVEASFFDELLGNGDLLFIDSTHTIRHDSDCLHIYLRILPSIRSDILVHVHDIYLPNTLPLTMMRDKQLFWNEQYMLYMYLLVSGRTKVIYGSQYHKAHNLDLLGQFMHGRYSPGGVSLWFDQFGTRQG